jgi:hypothetical protein
MKSLSLVAAASCTAAVLLGQAAPATAPASAARISADAVWTPPAGFLSGFHSACDALRGPGFSDCFLEQMRKAGAPPPALAFARRTGGMGYLRAFRETGKVDVAYAEYPFRANENQVCLLVNGEPPWIDVDDTALLDLKALAVDRNWPAILKKYPKAMLFPSDRGGPALPGARHFRDGRQEFIVDYVALDGCHACAAVGTVRFVFRFDAAGKFLGTAVKSVRRRG